MGNTLRLYTAGPMAPGGIIFAGSLALMRRPGLHISRKRVDDFWAFLGLCVILLRVLALTKTGGLRIFEAWQGSRGSLRCACTMWLGQELC